MKLLVAEPMGSGEQIRLRIPDVDPTLTAEGRVVWCSVRSENQFEIGVNLVDSDRSRDSERIYTRLREVETFRTTIQDLRGHRLSPAEAAREWRRRFGPRTLAEG